LDKEFITIKSEDLLLNDIEHHILKTI